MVRFLLTALLASFASARQLQANQTIAEIAAATPDLSTLVTALGLADLVGALGGDGPFTVFAPINDAFSALPDSILVSTISETDLSLW